LLVKEVDFIYSLYFWSKVTINSADLKCKLSVFNMLRHCWKEKQKQRCYYYPVADHPQTNPYNLQQHLVAFCYQIGLGVFRLEVANAPF